MKNRSQPFKHNHKNHHNTVHKNHHNTVHKNHHSVKNLLNLLNEYSFNKQNIEKIFLNIVNDEYQQKTLKSQQNIKQIKKINHTSDDNFIIPTENDSVFWCWYIFTKSLSKYTISRDRVFTTEKQEKINFIEKLRENKKMLKQFKIKICDMEANLTMGKKLDIIYLEPMIIMENYNFIYMDDVIYYENILDDDNKTCIIKYYKETDKYGLFLEKREKLKIHKLYKIDSLSKPIKAISNYKAQDIRDICKKLDINVMKSPTKFKTKKDLYHLIKEKIN